MTNKIAEKLFLLSYIFLISEVLFSSPVTFDSVFSEIQGRILSVESLETIPFASISIKNTAIGTCSNSRGEFLFHYPDSLKESDITIKSIGFKTKIVRLSSLANKNVDIFLEPETYQIPEIIVGPNQLTATDIVRQVIRRMHLNYSRSPYYMEGFLRDKVYNLIDNKVTRLTESAVDIVKKEFGHENSADKVKIIEIRNSYNYSRTGSWLKKKIEQAFWGYSTYNPIYKTLQYMDFTTVSALKEQLKNDLYRLYISGYAMFEGKPVVIIDIKEEYIKYMFQKVPTSNGYNLIRLYIDTDSFAMLKSEFFTVMKLPSNVKLHVKQDTIVVSAVKQYEKIENKYYLKYAGYFGRIHDQPDAVEMGETLYFNETELLINKVLTERREFDRIRHRDLLEKDVPLWDMKYIYNSLFWKNYNILIDKPLDANILKDLGQRIPLDNQFYDAGEKNSKK